MIDKTLEKIIDNSIKADKLAHCYLLKSEKGVDFNESILYIINRINNSTFDTLSSETLPYNVSILGEKNESSKLTKDGINDAFENSFYSNIEENKKSIFILKNIENAHPNALNSLLKTIEEPNSNTIFIFTTNNINKVLKTIKSRSLIINIKKQSNSELKKYLQQNSFSDVESWFFSYIFNDIKEIEEYTSKESIKHIFSMLQIMENNINDQYSLHLFLSKFNKKDLKNEFIVLIKTLMFVYSWQWNINIKVIDNLKKLYNKIIKANFDLKACFIVLEDFLSNLNDSLNFFLQAEKTMIKVMRIYE
ncbi:DNA polymerase III subunit delta' [Mycoplasma sp. Mirounga ES2805-ORL]|uniref:DNA polymerase III subunit delta' n=1 Tax=Mycoplasma sp. Mirounga ES2805-ORL TaxID=754514 RepID=UPI00197C6366|nr:DNA polymerase III subunit delta' [Mycoplasma sp. Mirounga ES2805-ORL]QSF13396.1 DNA polymerase III subunit delta' [Mycoplasma sp. Mirounga ES2805-ORL]